MTRRLRRLAFALAVATALTVLITMSASASTGQIPLSGTGSPQTGDFTPSAGDVTQDEFPTGESEQGPDPYSGTISLSAGAGSGASAGWEVVPVAEVPMLHFETYPEGTKDVAALLGTGNLTTFLDPTAYLLHLAVHGQ